MALTQSALAAELEDALAALTSTTPPLPAVALGNAWGAYFKSATLALAPVNSVAVDGGVALMVAALVFPESGTPASAAAIYAGAVQAFWADLVARASAYWPGAATCTPPVGLSGLAAALTTAFGANNAAGVTTHDAANALATALHGLGGVGGAMVVATVPVTII